MRAAAAGPMSHGAGGATSSIRRIQRELKEISESPSRHWAAAPAADDLFEWQFAIRGPPGTDFEGGIYTGRIVLPVNYPLAPPSISFLTPNGRWEIGKRICLSNTSYHPENWQPAWGIRTMMEALRSHFPVPGDGAIGAIDWPSDVRQRLAKESLDFVTPPGTKKNRELLPELSAEELKEDSPEPGPSPLAAASPTTDGEVEATAAEESTTSQQPSQRRIVSPEVASGVQRIESGLSTGGASGSASRPVRRRTREGPRPRRTQQSMLVQLMKPPETSRGWLLLGLEFAIFLLSVSFLWHLIDLIRDPPVILEPLAEGRDSAGP